MAETADAARTLIVALGNPLMGDDGAGRAVLDELRRRGAAARARLHDAGAAGVDLLLELEGVETLVLLDAVCTGDPPGAVRVLEGDEIRPYAEERGLGSHQPSLAATLKLAGQLGLLPRRVAIVGIAARQFGLGEGLSSEVAAAIPAAADAVARLLGWDERDGPPATLGPGAE